MKVRYINERGSSVCTDISNFIAASAEGRDPAIENEDAHPIFEHFGRLITVLYQNGFLSDEDISDIVLRSDVEVLDG